MHVKKFESETLDGALKEIKSEFGPDAIILKTETNKGLKGAFRKRKIEITAAISEKNYIKKAKVDSVLPSDKKELFYSDQAQHISNMIDKYDSPRHQDNAKRVASEGYGKFGINNSVKKVKDTQTGLDDFLNKPSSDNKRKESGINNTGEHDDMMVRINDLEKKVFELAKKTEDIDKEQSLELLDLKTTLRGLDINEKYIRKITKRAMVELSKEDIEDSETIYEFTLREMLSVIKTEMALFSKVDTNSSPTITLLVSQSQCGQSTMVHKLAALKEKSAVITRSNSNKTNFVQSIYNMETLPASSFSETVSNTRKYVEEGKTVFIDYKDENEEIHDVKKVVEGLKRSFGKVEVLICISSIHSEIYNKKMISKYISFSDGIIVTNLDLCVNYGSLFNIAYNYKGMPFKFFGTGNVVPDDIESATGERIIAGLFQLD